MVKTVSLVAALAATTMLAGGMAFAETQTTPAQTGSQATAVKDFGKLSADGSRGYQDIVLTRLAIFDGKTADAKKYIGEADTAFDKAQHDDTVFTKAEADMKAPGEKGQQASNGEAEASGKSGSGAEPSAAEQADMKTPKQWLPVDGEISLNEDYTTNTAKAAAVADANKSLAKGDRAGAIQKLKLAGIDMDVVLAVVPVKSTVSDVHQAASLIDSGKYYEASQLLRTVQNSTRFDVAEIDAVPTAGGHAAMSNKDQTSANDKMTSKDKMTSGGNESGSTSK